VDSLHPSFCDYARSLAPDREAPAGTPTEAGRSRGVSARAGPRLRWARMTVGKTRVVVRSLTAADRDAFVSAMRASRSFHHPWVAPPSTDAAFDSLLVRARGESVEAMVACRREDGVILGYFNLSQIIRGPFQSAFLGYGGVAEYRGRGYMTEGMMLVLRRAFGELRVHRVEANIQPGNDQSIALARRCGFVREGFSERYLKVGGRWRDHERWAIRAEQWRAQWRP
jgi:[ribosomal protein S5]-alanine N-acetyltransferase